jgi:hypothetical protein
MSEDGDSSVFVVQDGKAHRVAVKLGYESGKNVQVLAGLMPGAQVVVAGQNGLSEGTAVESVKLAAPVERVAAAP